MSLVAVGAVSPSYWSYMSAVLARRLDQIASSGEIAAAPVPAAVYDEAQRFFSLALQSAGDGLADDPPASVNAYSIAVDVTHGLSGGSLSEVDDRLGEYATFFATLDRPRTLKEDERKLSAEMSKFFRRLWAEGEASRHDSPRREQEPKGWI